MTTNTGVNHLGISVSDLEAAVSWYSENLGFRKLKPNKHFKRDETIDRKDAKHIFRVYGEPFREGKVAYLISGNVGIEIFQFIDPVYTTTEKFGSNLYTRAGCYHIALTNPDPEGFFGKLEKAGATKIGETAHLAQGQIILYLQDPFGIVWEICSTGWEDLVLGT